MRDIIAFDEVEKQPKEDREQWNTKNPRTISGDNERKEENDEIPTEEKEDIPTEENKETGEANTNTAPVLHLKS
ncbi:hypothetical protein QYM36_019370 [Artemia franciscana]|uniref:Uncharacterized protein n=1 Tax=Artemia franciscana TaxID=6661 RepID=A0AA88H7C4_ARTSF|nr:hypothetical protein QYM36_019370 [Artemia franciscana]